jgi:hypothetical protein
VVHAAKSGRFFPWAYAILMIPVFGALAYVFVEPGPEWFGSHQGKKARKHLVNTIDPGRRYRALTDELAITDTIANRNALAAECLLRGKFDEASHHYDEILTRPLGEEPVYMLGRARAEFGAGQPADTVATLDELRRRWPDYQSGEGHLLYARSLEEIGRTDEAIEEYNALFCYYPGAEARVRYGMLLNRLGREAEGKTVLNDLLTHIRRAPKFARKVQAEWIGMAEKALRANCSVRRAQAPCQAFRPDGKPRWHETRACPSFARIQ